MKIVSRAAWKAAPAKSVTFSDPAKLKGVVVHWFGKPRSAKTHAGCPALLRSVQAGHMAPGGLGAKKGGSDVGYNHAVCQHGVAYELRGFDRQTGANGTKGANRDYAAVVVMIGEGEKPTAAAKKTCTRLIGEWRKRGAGPEVRTHGSITGSACPGPDLTAWVAARGYEPPKPKPKPKPKPPAPVRVDVDAGTVTLRNQRADNPALAKRLLELARRFPKVVIRRKDPT